MKRLLAFLFPLALLAQQPAKDRTVILVSLDGFAAYALEDPQVSAPNLRRLMREGFSAKRMVPVNPTVTWPNHTSMVTGVAPEKHGVLYNGLFVPGEAGKPGKIEPWVPQRELVRVPTLQDAAHYAGLTSAEVDWVAIYKSDSVNWSFAERPETGDVVPREMIAAGLVTEAEVAGFAKAPITLRDEIWTRAAVHILRKHRPNLLLFHLLTTDSVQHGYGPRTLAAGAALALADARLGEILQALRDEKMLERTTVFVVSDHGFKTVKKQIRPNALLAQKGLKAYIVPEGGTAMLYAEAVTPELKSLVAGIDGVDRVIEPAEFGALGLPLPERHKGMAKLVLAAKDGYAFSGAAQGDAVVTLAQPAGSHGYVNTDAEMNAIFVAWGEGVPAARRVEEVRTIDIAPTIAALLGIELPNVDGKRIF